MGAKGACELSDYLVLLAQVWKRVQKTSVNNENLSNALKNNDRPS